MNKKQYNVYIDESGDEGIKRGSKFFVLTAILVEKSKDLIVSKVVDKIKENLEMDIKSQLHWNKIKGYPNKIMIMENIASADITIINVIINTDEINYIIPKDIYNHFSGYLYERICWFVKRRRAVANINISSRGEELTKKNLIAFLKKKSDKFTIEYDRINSIKIYPNAQKRLLQLADCCCSALGQALRYNNEQHHNYVYYLKDKIYKYGSKYISYGLKYVPTDSKLPKEIKKLVSFLEK